MTGLWITAGITLKVIYLLIFRSAKPESVLIFGPVIIPLLVGIGVLIIGELLFGPPGGEVLLPWGAIAAYYAIWVFMFFKDSLLPYITEGTLFSLWISRVLHFFTHAYTLPYASISPPITLFVVFYFFLSLIPILTKRTPNKLVQTFFMAMFLCMNIYIGLTLVEISFFSTNNPWELVIIGYSLIGLLSNVFYVTNLFRFGDMDEYLRHARELEEKYIAVNSTRHEIALTILVFIGLLLLHYVGISNEIFVVSIALVFISLIHTPPEKNKFIPMGISAKL